MMPSGKKSAAMTFFHFLSNTRDRVILTELNNYPVISLAAHTRPFERKWKNVMAALFFPLGIILYIRMCRFRLRLYRDLRAIKRTNGNITRRIEEASLRGAPQD